jgi:hypothetical protein
MACTRVLPKGESYLVGNEVIDVPPPPDCLEVRLTRESMHCTSDIQFPRVGWTPTCFPGAKYDLQSFLLFSPPVGEGIGHFTACGRAKSNGQWFHHDSQHVRRLESENAHVPGVTSVLFYRRVDAPVPDGPVIGPRLGCRWHHNNCYINAVVTTIDYAYNFDL